MLHLENVSKTYAGRIALSPTTFTVRESRTSVLIGPSGCGKSTLLRLMIGLILPDDGTVAFQGTLLSPDNVLKLRHRMGYVIQDGGLFPHLTAEQNVELLARHLNWPEPRIQERLQELGRLTHLPPEMLRKYPSQLSGGQLQRVSLMRALMLDPDVLLLDEPLGALDPMIRAELQSELRDIFRALEKTVVLVTHDLAEAAYFSDTIVLMRAGRIVQQGNFATLMNSPADPFVTQFINAQRTHLAGELA